MKNLLPTYILDLEESYPTREEARIHYRLVIENRRQDKAARCVFIIHGYGSSGKGGVIRDDVRQWLEIQKKKKFIKTVVYGENFELFNDDARRLKNTYRGLDCLMGRYNHGVTVVEL